MSQSPPLLIDLSDLECMETGSAWSMRALSEASYPSEIYPDDSASQWQAPSVTSEPSSVVFIDDVTGPFRTAHGRDFNTRCDLYMLPADDREHWRQDVQHRILQLMLGGSIYMPVSLVQRALTPSPICDEPRVLDIGAGSGRWAVEMALQFPESEVVGLDLVPPSIEVSGIPPNCRFEFDNANLPLSHYKNCFNVIHSRAIDPGIVNFESFLYNVAQALRPLGILLLCSGTPQLFDEMKQPLKVVEKGQLGFTWIQRYWAAVYNAYRNVGSENVDATTYWHRWLLENPNYQNVQSHDIYIPIGPWMNGLDEQSRYVADLMRWNIIQASHSYKALLIKGGFPKDMIECWLIESKKELEALGVHAYVRWRYTWAERCHGPWEERLEQPLPLEAYPRLLQSPRDTSDTEERIPCGEARGG